MNLIQAVALGLAAWQGVALVSEEQERSAMYAQAQSSARSLGKPMLVIGGPYGTTGIRKLFNLAAHGCGDDCIDVDPRACQGCPSAMVADIREIPYDDGYFGAALASHVLEHLPSIDDVVQALNEMGRVADEVFIASPSKTSLLAWFHPGHRLWINEGPHGIMIEERVTKARVIYRRQDYVTS